MDKKASLSETKKTQIVIWHKKGFSQRKICKQVFCSKTAVHQAIATFQNFGFYHDKKKEWKAKKTSARDDNWIQEIVVWPATSFCKRIRAALFLKDTAVHRSTVIKCLDHDFNLKAF